MTSFEQPDQHHLLCVKFIDKKLGIAASDWGKIILTEDGGRSWEGFKTDGSLTFFDICMGGEGVMFHK